MSWGRQVHEGWVTEMVGPVTAPKAAQLLDPDAPWVLLLDHLPVERGEWLTAHVPTHEGTLTNPQPMTVSRLRYDALMSTTAFLGLAPMLADHGLTALQLTKHPRVDVDWRDRTPGAFLAKRKAHGLLLSIDLPHANEVAQVTALAEPELDAALARAHL